MYAFFLSRVSLHNTGTQSYLRSLHYPFTRARCRVRSAWLAHGSKFLKAYYDTYPGVWRHGDFIAMNPRTKGLIIIGRRFAPSSLPRLSLLACAEMLMPVYQ